MPDYDERIRKLMSLYRLSFTHNAGGGEVYDKDGWRCQFHMQSDEDDYSALVNALQESKSERIEEVLAMIDKPLKEIEAALAR